MCALIFFDYFSIHHPESTMGIHNESFAKISIFRAVDRGTGKSSAKTSLKHHNSAKSVCFYR